MPASLPKRNQPVYAQSDWRRRTSPLVRQKNPLCQRVEDGKQCLRPSKIVHHLKDPSDAPESTHDWANLVAVCEEHHPGGQRGAAPDEVYVHTIGVGDTVYRHKGGYPIWHKDYVKSSTPQLKELYNSASDTSAINKALKSVEDLLNVELP